MSSLTEPATSDTRRLRPPSLGVAGREPPPRRTTAPRPPVGVAGFGRVVVLPDPSGPVVILPDSWHLPGRHEHGRPLLAQPPGLALARSWS